MTAETLHDALNLLPSDLITGVDALRSRKPARQRRRWHHWAALAACFVLLAGTGLLLRRQLTGAGTTEQAAEVPAAEAPAARAPEIMDEAPAVPEAAPEEEPREAAPSQDAAKTENGLGGAEVTVTCGGAQALLSGADAGAVLEILETLAYSRERICRCMGEYTVESPALGAVAVNLEEGFARCAQGQADLTAEQTEQLRQILEAAFPAE